jgi:ArsR family transcriptional regulator, lead/cadmium/zinc/bismuth-responsive transcriptional repressor
MEIGEEKDISAVQYELPVCEQTVPHPDVVERVRAQMPDPEQQQQLADLFRMFGDTSRIRILAALQHSELCVCDLAQLLGLTVSAVSHQLRLLKTAGLVGYRREGKNVIYALADEHVHTIMKCGTEHILE